MKIRYKEPQAEVSELLSFPLRREAVRGASREATDDFRFVAAVAEKALGNDPNGYRREFLELVRNAQVIQGRENQE